MCSVETHLIRERLVLEFGVYLHIRSMIWYQGCLGRIIKIDILWIIGHKFESHSPSCKGFDLSCTSNIMVDKCII